MTKVPYNGDPWGGAQVAAYIGAQFVLQRLNCVVPGRWRMAFGPVGGDPLAASTGGDRRSRLYLNCRLLVSLPISPGGPDVEAVYEDVGELDAGSLRRPEGALLRRPQARRRRRRDRRLPVHRARGRRAADRSRYRPRAVHPPLG
jgi:hypothetical protein